MEEGRLRKTAEAFLWRFASEQPMRIAIEAGTRSPWASRVLEECGHEVLVANARKLTLIYANKRKTDENDAENLARLARVDPKLLYPLKHRGERSQAHRAIIRSREALVSCRTQLVNHVRGALKSFGARLPKCPARSFHNRGSHPRGQGTLRPRAVVLIHWNAWKVLRTSLAGSCIERLPRAARMAPEATLAAWEGSTCYGA
jgi:transposase